MFIAHRVRLIAFQIDIVNKIFVQNLDNPPLYKNHPPVAGAIYWERSLFFRIKHTILRFQEVEEILDSDRGREVRCFAGTVPLVYFADYAELRVWEAAPFQSHAVTQASPVLPRSNRLCGLFLWHLQTCNTLQVAGMWPLPELDLQPLWRVTTIFLIILSLPTHGFLYVILQGLTNLFLCFITFRCTKTT